MTQAEKVKKIAKVLKRRYTDLNNAEAVHIAYLILEAIEEPPTKVEIKPDGA